MSLGCIANYWAQNAPALFEVTKNGECRILKKSDTELTDDQGYPNSPYEPRTVAFLPCVWIAKRADEHVAGEMTRSLEIYEIQIPQKLSDGSAVVVDESDRLELRLMPGASTAETLEISARVNQSNVFWQIFAADFDSEG